MVDRVYKADLPALRKALEELRREFAQLDSSNDWVAHRAETVLRHAQELEKQLRPLSSIRLTRGVRLLHSDLVYLRENVDGLNEILASEDRSLPKRKRVAK